MKAPSLMIFKNFLDERSETLEKLRSISARLGEGARERLQNDEPLEHLVVILTSEMAKDREIQFIYIDDPTDSEAVADLYENANEYMEETHALGSIVSVPRDEGIDVTLFLPGYVESHRYTREGEVPTESALSSIEVPAITAFRRA